MKKNLNSSLFFSFMATSSDGHYAVSSSAHSDGPRGPTAKGAGPTMRYAESCLSSFVLSSLLVTLGFLSLRLVVRS
jgi:hypothetical protein